MEGCLKKLVLEAEAMGFWDPWKGGWEPMGASDTKTVLGGPDREYIRYRRETKKLIPV